MDEIAGRLLIVIPNSLYMYIYKYVRLINDGHRRQLSKYHMWHDQGK